jgi:methyltransferase (TIGR00027 family)
MDFGMNIRLATEKDIEQISILHLDSYKMAGEDILPETVLKKLTREILLSRWQSRFLDKTLVTLVAEKDSLIQGFVTVINFNCIDDIKKEKAELKFLYIHVDHLRKKIGTQLALHMAKILIENGYNSISGYALKKDTRSNGFYSFLGAETNYSTNVWIPLGSTPETYPDGTYADVNHYTVNDLKKTLVLLQNKQSRNFKSSDFDSSTTARPVVAIKAVTKLPSFWEKTNKGTRKTMLTHGNCEDIFTSEQEKANVWNREDIANIQCVSARERFINKTLEDYVKKRGCKQIINLGSGFDIRAYKKNTKNQEGKKNSHIYSQVKYFEIDRKNILDEKERIFNENKIDKNAIFIGIDYIKENFTEKLKNEGADLTQPTLIIWEGNWMYLENNHVEIILDKIKKEFKEATIVFDYTNSALLEKYSQKFNIWKEPKRGIDDIETFASQHGMKVEKNKTSFDLLIKYKIDNKPVEDLSNHSVCAIRI